MMPYEDLKKKYESIFNTTYENTPSYFHKLYKQEGYHEKMLFELLSDSVLSKQILKNLFNVHNIGILVVELRKEVEFKDNNGKHRIDILIKVKNQTDKSEKHIILELKTVTQNHDGQLTAYYNHAKGINNNIEPYCFYVTQDKSEPDTIEKEDPNIIQEYKPITYKELVEGILDKQNKPPAKGELKSIFEDYIKTVQICCAVETNKKLINQNPHLYYSCYLKKIIDLLTNENIDCSHAFIVNDKKDPTYTDFCHTKSNGILAVYIKVNNADNTNSLILMSIWKDEKHSLLYGIEIYGIENKTETEKLLADWKQKGKEIFFPTSKRATINYIPDIFQGGAQKLTDWVMPHVDNGIMLKGISDCESLANWIKEDLKKLK